MIKKLKLFASPEKIKWKFLTFFMSSSGFFVSKWRRGRDSNPCDPDGSLALKASAYYL